MKPILANKCITPVKPLYNLPDFRDGLTPLQRDIVWAIRSEKTEKGYPYIKSWKIIERLGGQLEEMSDHWVWGKSAEIQDILASMTQKYHTIAVLDGHGNFGSLYTDGNSAAPRFTAVKTSAFCQEAMLKYCNKKTVGISVASHLPKTTPAVFLSRVPGSLLFGTHTSAEGFISQIPSHNLGEIILAMLAMIDDPQLQPEDLLKYIKGPDFVTGGVILNKHDLPAIYQTGQGSLRIRGRYDVEVWDDNRTHIIIHEIPITLSRQTEAFAQMLKHLSQVREIPGIDDVTHDSFCFNIDITLKNGADAQAVVQKICQMTPFEQTVDYQAILIANNVPCRMSLHAILSEHLDFYRSALKIHFGDNYSDNVLRNELIAIYRKYATPRKTAIVDL